MLNVYSEYKFKENIFSDFLEIKGKCHHKWGWGSSNNVKTGHFWHGTLHCLAKIVVTNFLFSQEIKKSTNLIFLILIAKGPLKKHRSLMKLQWKDFKLLCVLSTLFWDDPRIYHNFENKLWSLAFITHLFPLNWYLIQSGRCVLFIGI